jgi:hypothetical protein
MRRISRRLTYANVISTVALFLALGGGAALAATNLAKNSVGPKAIKANAVGPAKIKAGAVTGEKIAAGAVGANQLANGAVGATKLASGAVGGTQLANGSVGPAQLAAGAVGGSKLGAINTRTVSVPVAKGEIKGASASCSAGEVLLGGGTSWSTTGPEQLVYTSESNKSAPTTWHAAGINGANVTLTFNVFAYCIAG